MVASFSIFPDNALPDFHFVLFLGNIPRDSIKPPVIDVDHGVGIINGCNHEPLGVIGGRGHDHLEARDMSKNSVKRLGMLRGLLPPRG